MNYGKLRTLFLDAIIFSVPVIGALYLLTRIFHIFVPFLAGFFIYSVAKPLNGFLLRHKVHRFTAAIICVAVCGAAVCFLFGFIFMRAFREISHLANTVPAVYASDEVFDIFTDKLSALTRKTFHLRRFSDEIINRASVFFNDFAAGVSKNIFSAVISSAKNVPSAVICIFVAFISAFFFIYDQDKIRAFFRKISGDEIYEKTMRIKHTFFGALTSYLKAQLFVGIIIFSVLFFGLCILRVSYAPLLAAVISFVDMIPVLGTGTILIPWAIVRIFSDNPSLGWGLLSLYGVCLFTRQICEPKIIGSKMGLHPLAGIFSIYAGMKLLGVFGIILGPIFAFLVKNLIFSE